MNVMKVIFLMDTLGVHHENPEMVVDNITKARVEFHQKYLTMIKLNIFAHLAES